MNASKKQSESTENVASDNIHSIIMQYIDDKVPCGCMSFPAIAMPALFIFKHVSKNTMKVALDNAAIVTQSPIEQVKNGAAAFNKMLTEYPMITMVDTAICVHYNGCITLNCAEPNFFEQLDRVLELIMTSDSLAGFSL